jgi:hypothetical protein
METAMKKLEWKRDVVRGTGGRPDLVSTDGRFTIRAITNWGTNKKSVVYFLLDEQYHNDSRLNPHHRCTEKLQRRAKDIAQVFANRETKGA